MRAIRERLVFKVLKAGLFVPSFKTWAEEHKQGELIKVSFKRKKEKPLRRRYLKYNTVITFKENVVAGIK